MQYTAVDIHVHVLLKASTQHLQCSRQTVRQTDLHKNVPYPPEPGCCPCHRGITIGDWRDPLDPYLDAQVVYSQYQQGKSTLVQKYLGGKEEEGEEEDQDITPIPSPTGVEGERGNQVDWSLLRSKSLTRELMTVLKELAYHHSQVSTT